MRYRPCSLMATCASGWRIGPRPSWPRLGASASKRLAIGWGGAVPISGLYGTGTSRGELPPSVLPNGAGDRPFFPRRQRVHIERVACTDPAAYGLHLARWDCRSLPPVIVEQAVVGAIHSTTVARLLAAASWQPHRRRYGKTTTIEERCTTTAAKIVWRYERVAWLYEPGEVGLYLDEQPHLQALAQRVPAQPMRPGQIERRECA
jgi:hypothetical protein